VRRKRPHPVVVGHGALASRSDGLGDSTEGWSTASYVSRVSVDPLLRRGDAARRAQRRGQRLTALEFRAWRAFLYAYARVVPRLDQELSSAQDLSLNQFEVLMWLRRAGARGLRMSDLASRVVLSPSGVTRAIDQLERKGLVKRTIFEGDKRGYVARFTPKGRARLRTATSVHVHGIREHFVKHLSRTELENLSTALQAILDGEGSSLPPPTS
jgi:DNA-binding MarR family transcriptional regulator